MERFDDLLRPPARARRGRQHGRASDEGTSWFSIGTFVASHLPGGHAKRVGAGVKPFLRPAADPQGAPVSWTLMARCPPSYGFPPPTPLIRRTHTLLSIFVHVLMPR